MAPTKKELVWAAVVMLMLPLFAELALRAGRVQFDPQLYVPDQGLGWRLRPNTSGVISAETKQHVRINSHGFRDRERAYEKAPETIRIAVLGNSWTEALQVPLDKTYCSVLEQKVVQSACFAGKRVEVLNFGVAGYSTGQELLLLRQEVWRYHPDIILVAFYPARDIANNLRELNNAVNPEQSPYFVYRDGKLLLDDSFRALPALHLREMLLQEVRYRVTEHVRVFQAISALQRAGKIRVAMAALRERAERSRVDNLEYTIYAPPRAPDMQTAWHVTEGLLLAMRDEVNSHGADFRIVVLPTRPQVNPDRAKRVELMRELGVSNLSYADDRLSDFGARDGIRVTALAPELSSYAEAHHEFLSGFNNRNLGAGHWNETGHRVAAETIAAALCGKSEGKEQASAASK
jgi:hypothetical protein